MYGSRNFPTHDLPVPVGTAVNVAQYPGTSQSDFIASIRRALGRPGSDVVEPVSPRADDGLEELEARAVELNHRLKESRGELVSRLAETAALRGWNVHRASSGEAAVGMVVDVAEYVGARQVARSGQDVFSEIPVDEALGNAGLGVSEAVMGDDRDRDEVRRGIIRSDVGVTGVDYAVAETGSVVVVPRAGLSRLVSLVPPVHIALVRPGDVVESLDDVFLLRRLEYLRNGGDMGSYLNFITGPSRTADIEQTIVIGVHGPKEVHMVLLDEE